MEGEAASETEKRSKKQKNKTAEMCGKAYFHAFLRFSIVSISVLRCFHTPTSIFLTNA